LTRVIFLLPRETSVTWFDEGTPWELFEVEEVIYDVNIEDVLEITRNPS